MYQRCRTPVSIVATTTTMSAMTIWLQPTRRNGQRKSTQKPVLVILIALVWKFDEETYNDHNMEYGVANFVGRNKEDKDDGEYGYEFVDKLLRKKKRCGLWLYSKDTVAEKIVDKSKQVARNGENVPRP